MSDAKPVRRTFVFSEDKAPKERTTVGFITVEAAAVVQVSNYADLRDKNGETFATITWPSRYTVREV